MSKPNKFKIKTQEFRAVSNTAVIPAENIKKYILYDNN